MMKQLMNKFANEEKGAPIVELVILIAMSALIAAFLFPTLRTNLGNWFNDMVDNVTQGIGGGGKTAEHSAGDKTGTSNGGAWGTP